jgi:acyl-[acyl-carrier-protein]-phospholipid O-acyltransferase/long-chain-fatty-acid--[acyl-carrier-protein] ligase
MHAAANLLPGPVLASFFDGNGPTILACIVALAVSLGVWTYVAPAGPLRLLLVLMSHSVYWMRRFGADHVPRTGGALIVCTPVSYLDWLLIWSAAPRRPRLVVMAGWAGRPRLRRLLCWTGAIAVDARSTPRDVVRALREARVALNRGELVVLFADSQMTPGGLDLPFHRTFGRVARKTAAPIIPVCIDQTYGSLFANYHGRFLWKLPPSWPYPIDVVFGAPLPASTSAAVVRQAVQSLWADHAVAHADEIRPAHRQFIRMAAKLPFHPCLIDSSVPGGRKLPYGRSLAAAVMLGRLLRPVLGETQNVGIRLPPSVGGALANIAVAILGKTSVNLNYSSTAVVVQASIKQAGIRHVLTSRRFTERLKFDGGPSVEVVYLEDLLPKVSKVRALAVLVGTVLLPGWLLERLLIRGKGHEPSDVATLVFSSGSTGEPKGVVLTHANVASNANAIVQAVGAAPRDRILGVLPLFHSFGYTVTLWTPMSAGATGVYHPDPRQAKEIGELCRTHRCTIYLSTATFLRFCLKRCNTDDFKSLNMIVCGAEKLPVSLSDDFEQRFGIRALEGYGCTEVSPAAVISHPDVVIDGFRQYFQRAGSIGQALPGIVGRIVNPDTDEVLPSGQEGLLEIHGPNVMRGYLDRPDLTAKVVRNGWYATGDVGRIDSDGFVWLTGRLSRFAKCGGEMVPLERIEEVLHDILSTSERVCGVTCVPDESRGERLLVLYVAAHLEQYNLEVRAWCQQLVIRGLPKLWVPAERDFIPVPEIPVLGSGKMDLKRLKDLALELTGK